MGKKEVLFTIKIEVEEHDYESDYFKGLIEDMGDLEDHVEMSNEFKEQCPNSEIEITFKMD